MTQHSIQDLSENFSLFDNWEDRYRYLIDLGKELPPMPEELKTDERLVKGCTSRVWMEPKIEDGRFYFVADSDAHIVRGLIALLVAAYNGQELSKIGEIDIDATFKEIGLDQHLSPNRRNGFFSMVDRIRSLSSRA